MRHPDREREGGLVVLLLLAGLVVLLGGGYAAAYAVAGDNVPRGTTVAGVPVGGHSPDVAQQVLSEQLGPRASAPLTLVVDGREVTVDPVEAGLAVDYDASVAAAGGGRSWSPERLWAYFTGGEELAPVVTVDEEALQAALVDLTQQVGAPARDGDLVFSAGGVRAVPPADGRALDPGAATAAIREAYLADADAPPPEISTVPTRPDIDEQDVQKALDRFGNPAMSGPVTLVFDRAVVRLSPQQFGPALDVRAVDGRLVPEVDERPLMRLVERAVSRRGDPVDASFRIVDGEPVVVPARPGVRFRPADVTDAFLAAVRSSGDERRRTVATRSEPAELSTREARRLGVEERVSTFTTYYPHADYRNTNIGRAAELVDGTLLEPGETFSLNDVVGERTRRNGFTEGFVINNGVFAEDLGGGVSQIATTTFNAMFFAGLEDVEHKPHSFYIDRYPVGREATVAWGSVDLRFRNDTPYGVFITAQVAPSTPSRSGVVTVSMYSTKVWDITSRTSDRYATRPPGTRTVSGPECVPQEGYPGFDVDVTRVFRRAGESAVHHTEVFHTSYIAADRVICR